MNFIAATRRGACPNSFQNWSFTCGIPLPAASGQNALSNQPTRSEVTTTTAKLIAAKRDKPPPAGALNTARTAS